MRHLILAAFAVLVLSFAGLSAKPDRKDDAPKKMPPMPSLADWGETNWGRVFVSGKRVEIRNHPHWEADGEWRYRNGRWELLLLWTENANGRSGPGLYTIDSEIGGLAGWWRYEEDVKRNDDGSIDGLSFGDTIFRLKVDK